MVDTELDAFLKERRARLVEGEALIDEIDRLVGAGGKRLRPAFCYWGHRAGGGKHSVEIVRASASLELLHTFAIVHDDIMDESEERRGQPTVHVTRGVGVAILVGDLALVLADALFLGSGFGPEAAARAFAPYSLMRQEVISGQHMDLVAASREVIGEQEARRIAVLKSGRYSIAKPLVLGASLAGAPDRLLEDLAGFGDPLGEAFQLRDDLLGTFGNRARVGKPVDSDIREGKRHVLFAKAAAALAGEELSFFLSRWGADDLVAEEIDRLRTLMVSSGARSGTEALLEERTISARRALATLDVPDDARRALEALTEQATTRSL